MSVARAQIRTRPPMYKVEEYTVLNTHGPFLDLKRNKSWTILRLQRKVLVRACVYVRVCLRAERLARNIQYH